MRRIRPWKFRPVFTYNTGMGTYILDRKQAAALAPDPAEYNVMIRITNPRGEFLQLEHEHSFRDILSLRFYDIDDEDSPLYLFNETHLEQCLRFFEKHRNCRNMIVHCDEGRSRSAGVAIGWFLFNGIVKHDLDTGTETRYRHPDGVYGSETAFAPRVGGSGEDDGYLITLTTDMSRDLSECLVFDARRLADGPVCRIRLPERVSSGTHATWAQGSDIPRWRDSDTMTGAVGLD